MTVETIPQVRPGLGESRLQMGALVVAAVGLSAVTVVESHGALSLSGLRQFAGQSAPVAAGVLRLWEAIAFGAAAVMTAAIAVLPRVPRGLRFAPVVPALAVTLTSGTVREMLAALAVLTVAHVLGLFLLRRLDLRGFTRLETFLLASATGLGVVAFLMFALGLVGALRPIPLAIVGVAFSAAAIGLLRKGRRSAPVASTAGPWNAPAAAIAIVAVLLVETVVPYVPAPDLSYDATYYHLTMVREFVERGAVVELPNLFASDFPLLPHMTYAAASAFSSLDAAKFVNFGVGLLAAGAVFALGTRVADARAGLLAAALWLSIPLVTWEMTTAYVDLYMALFGALSVLAALSWHPSRRPAGLYVSGAMLGLGFGVKPTMALVAGPLFLVLLVARVRTWRALLHLCGASSCAALIASPWYLRAWLLTGNPVFPFLNGIFRSPKWEPSNDSFNFSMFGDGSSLQDLALLPWHLTFRTGHFVEMPDGALGIIPLVGLIGFFALFISPAKKTLLLTGVFALSVLMWFYYAQYVRYFIPSIPIVAVVAGAALARPMRSRWSASIVVGLVVAAAIVGTRFMLDSEWYVPGRVPWEVVLGKQSRTQFLSESLRHYDAYTWMGDHLPANAKVLGVGLSIWPIAYSPDPIYIAHATFEGRQVVLAPSEAAAEQALRDNSFEYVLIDYFPHGAPWQQSYPVAKPKFVADHLQLLYASHYVYLYVVRDGHPPTRTTPELLRDAAGQDLAQGQAWTPVGSQPATPGTCDGRVVGPGYGAIQAVQIRPDTLYTLRYRMRSLGAGKAAGKVQVSWSRSGNPGDFEAEIFDVTEAAQDYAVSSTTPPDATGGVVDLSGFGSDPVCVEQVSLTVAS